MRSSRQASSATPVSLSPASLSSASLSPYSWGSLTESSVTWLVVDFCGDERDVGNCGSLTFGRSGDLAMDDDPYLHRLVGEFLAADGHWWLRNRGSRLSITVGERAGSSRIVLGPGAVSVMAPGQYGITFSSGPTRYELDVVVEPPERGEQLDGADAQREGGSLGEILGEHTLEWGRVDLNSDQRRLLVALSTPQLLAAPGTEVAPPTNRSVAISLGWTVTKLNRKLDHLCLKLSRAGVAGLHGDVAALAADRRKRLVDHAVAVGLVSASDLIDEEPRTSETE